MIIPLARDAGLSSTEIFLLDALMTYKKPLRAHKLYEAAFAKPCQNDDRVKTSVCLLRKKVSGFGVAIYCRRGEGYYLPPESRARVEAYGL